MDADIQFGDLEEQAPKPCLRPDRNKQYAVAACGSPRDDELPIFVALDVMRDMESHALSDTRVELGGVMLGGQFVDEEGRPFVVISDSLRAEHYEATKGSFKFTHDTWEQITRQREEFPEDVQMVGWYHTHPDWGVFLSGMDMFICDNFFNKLLDVALVIDPCRDDRGFFQWTPQGRQRVHRVGGFYLTASRFRAEELEQFADWLEGSRDMTPAARLAGATAGGAPVVHVSSPREPWLGPALMGMLALQFCFLFLIAWKMLMPVEPGEAAAAQNKQLEALVAELEKQNAIRDRELAAEAQGRLIDRVLARLNQNTEGMAGELEARDLEIERLTAESAALGAVVRERQVLAAEKQTLADRLADSETRAKNASEYYAKIRKESDEKIAKLEKELAALKKPPEAEGEQAAGWWPPSWQLIGIISAVVAALAGAIGLTLWFRRPEWGDEELEEPKKEDSPPNNPETP